jgi:predicted TIM-barrel fold metal-dependent hydrolase
MLFLAAAVIDVHLHAQSTQKSADEMLAAMKEHNVVAAVLIGTDNDLAKYEKWFSGSIPALIMPCEEGKTPNGGARCYADGRDFPDLAQLRERIKEGKVRMLGEVTAQYSGIAPDDPRLEPYYALAEETDIPVGIHLGIGPPGAAYPLKGFPPRKSPHYAGAAGDPMLLESVLTRHPKLRLYVMHAAWPNLDHMLYMLYMHPQLYVDISVLQYAVPRPEYYRYLRTLVEAGFGDRIMFGSDGGPKHLVEGIAAIEGAPFLSEQQKAAILYQNAARFFRTEGRNTTY